ncbi:MAG: homocysteine S-methyltransferase family protein, partial [Gemmatimonadaceae bacterium]|nr:homocysteine S-methyltransferase family protein [Gemmatimonadaceae bacterium]
MSAPIGTDAVVSNGTRTRERLLARLTDPDAVIVFDGAMGTMLYQRGVFINQCYDELSLRAPDLVRGVHEEYVKAGAEVLETNSFGANRFKLAHFGLEREVASINGAAARVAREAAGDVALVAGAVGPLGVRLEPYGPTSLEEARAAFEEQIVALRDGGVDCLILETFADLDEVTQAVLAARAVAPALPLIAQMTVDVEGVTVFGVTPEDVARSL